MGLTVEIDPGSGFCGGVIRAISRAETFLENEGKLYSLGSIVHNEAELDRLSRSGLETVDSLKDLPSGATVLIRAHGEPPRTYRDAETLGVRIIDCTCPVVLKLQQHIREAYARLHADGRNGQLILFGKIGHAEVLGLVGQVGGDALVVENLAMLEDAVKKGLLRTDAPAEIFSQTTKSPSEYAGICRWLEERMPGLITVHDTICAQVATRHEALSDFARNHDVIVFVAGSSSSNGRVLCELCRSVNPRTHRIGSVDELLPEWFSPGDTVGICGATSTPKWLLEEVGDAVRNEKFASSPTNA